MESAKANGRAWMAPFFTMWTGQAFSLLGSQLTQFALVWWITKTTGSATLLATATMVALLPGVLIGPFAGALVDRWHRRTVMMVADGGIAFFSAWLGYLFYIGAAQPWHVYVIMFARAVGGAFHWPAMQASTSLMVPKEQLSRVAGLNQTLNGAMNILAPALGALVVSIMPLYGVMLIDVVTAALAVSILSFVHVPQPDKPQTAEDGPKSLLRDVHEAFHYIGRWPGLTWVVIAATMINFLLNPAFYLMPILVLHHFGGDAIQLGALNSGYGIGAVIGGLILSAWGGFRRRIFTSLMGVIGIGVGTLLMGLAPQWAFWMAMVGVLLTGVMYPITNGPVLAVIQSSVAPEIQGRVFTVMQAGVMAMSPLSMLVAGPIADAVGVRAWYWVAGAASIVAGVAGFFVPAIVYLEDGHSAAQPACSPAASPDADS
jgi:DHA3 family macrolide efflux protein-like MFS transporter